VKGNKGASL